MNLYIKQHIFSWSDRFTVYDEAGNDRYYVEGEIFSWGKKLHLFDTAGRELAFIRQRLFTFLPRYYIEREGAQTAEVVKEFTFFRHRYMVNGPDWSVQGDFFCHEYEITCANGIVAEISKAWFTFGDAYRIDITDGIDEVTALAAVLVIDACIDADNNN